MKKFRSLSFNQKITIVILIVIPLLAVFIPIYYENLKKPKLLINLVQFDCADEKGFQGIYRLIIENKGRAAATNLEIRMYAKPAIYINEGSVPSTVSISTNPVGDDPELGLDILVVKVSIVPPSSYLDITMWDNSVGDEPETIATHLYLSENVAVDVQQISYDQGHFAFEKEFFPCPPKVEATWVPAPESTSYP
jgi:hypothetical protein